MPPPLYNNRMLPFYNKWSDRLVAPFIIEGGSPMLMLRSCRT